MIDECGYISRVRYADRYEFYSRVIRAVMSLRPIGGYISDKEVEILCCMCIEVEDGGDLTGNIGIMDRLCRCPIGCISDGVFRNYKSSLKRGGWIVDSGGSVVLCRILTDVVGRGRIGIEINR